MRLPFAIDSNTATIWRDGNLHFFHSAGEPRVTTFDGQTQTFFTEEARIDRRDHFPMWIESVWQDPSGPLWAWYHHERVGDCPNLNVPEIGALVSYDGGRSFTDLGIIMASGEWTNCDALNGYFANGHGDFSVVADREGQYLYFLFGAYGGDLANQGVAIARMPISALWSQQGAVWKYYEGGWTEPGLYGRVTPVFPAVAGWEGANTDSFWGPSIHWNSHIGRFVVVMNRSCCGPKWPQAGMYVTMTSDLANPSAWTEPAYLTGYDDWYPWVLGLGAGEGSAEAGQQVRFFIRNHSEWELHLRLEEPSPPEALKPDALHRPGKNPQRKL
jgi:hypothetical protein